MRLSDEGYETHMEAFVFYVLRSAFWSLAFYIISSAFYNLGG
jgi:hypothetical protein